jgi:tetratricopeptide (TPR) repeat protein
MKIIIFLSFLNFSLFAQNKEAEDFYKSGLKKIVGTFDYQGAIEDFNKAIKLKPNFAEAYHSRGYAKYRLSDLRGSISDDNQAIKLKPNYVDAYMSRAGTRDKLGDFRGAVEDYNNVIKLDPDNKTAYMLRGYSKYSLGYRDDACLDWSKAGELGDYYAYTVISEKCK